jgi:hypothetical protein
VDNSKRKRENMAKVKKKKRIKKKKNQKIDQQTS